MSRLALASATCPRARRRSDSRGARRPVTNRRPRREADARRRPAASGVDVPEGTPSQRTRLAVLVEAANCRGRCRVSSSTSFRELRRHTCCLRRRIGRRRVRVTCCVDKCQWAEVSTPRQFDSCTSTDKAKHAPSSKAIVPDKPASACTPSRSTAVGRASKIGRDRNFRGPNTPGYFVLQSLNKEHPEPGLEMADAASVLGR